MDNVLKSRIRKALKHPLGSTIVLFGYRHFKFIPDRIYLKIMYRYFFDKSLNLKNPRTFNEKLQWIKLYDRKSTYTVMVDKVKARDFVSRKIGKKYLIPIIGVWDKVDDIDFNSLPNQFVIKCNHNSGKGMCICKDKTKLDIEDVKNKLREGLKEDYFYSGREWPYKNVPRKIICEKYMVDETGEGLNDYKVLCFNGKPKLIELHMGRFTDHQTQDIYDIHWNKTTMSQANISDFQVSSKPSPPPDTLSEMIACSEILAKGIPHIRVDWYSINGHLYFGELTFFDGSGFDPWDNPKDDLMMGKWINLPFRKNK